MPKRDDLKKIMIIGSGPIIISQACEFDYSGTQAVKALREEGMEVVLVNSNPATIMTDPEMADRTYIEPITPGNRLRRTGKRTARRASAHPGRPNRAFNTALQVAETGILEKLGIEMIGATPEVIQKAESRELFRKAMENIGLQGAGERHLPQPGPGHGSRRPPWAFPWWCGPHSPWAAPAAAWPSTRTN